MKRLVYIGGLMKALWERNEYMPIDLDRRFVRWVPLCDGPPLAVR